MEQVTANFSGKIRRAKRAGREHIVAPLNLIVPGVLNGSQGPLLYPEDEITKNVDAWNAMRLVVYHPKKNGLPTSARSPDVLDKHEVGEIFHTKVENGVLQAEAWFDVEKTRRVDNRILSDFDAGKSIEISTGLFTDNEPAEDGATHNEKPYSFIARNYRPDHLAVLPDQVGACSVADGCGLNVNENESQEAIIMALSVQKKKALIEGLISNDCCWDEEDREVLNAFSDEKLEAFQENAEKEKQSTLVANAAKEAFEDAVGTKHTFNDETKKWDSEAKKEEKPAENKEEKKVETKKPETTEEWMASAPEEVRRGVQNSMAIVQREKENIVAQLTTNASTEDKPGQTKRLMGRSLDELRSDLALMPKPEKQETTENAIDILPSFLGASVPSSTFPELDQDDAPFQPTINWKKEREIKV